MKVLISERLSEHKYKTPEGYLICTDAILARTGKQRYTKDELFGDGDSEEVDVDRPYEQVMNEKTISSFENKPVTFDHPDEDVNVGNYKEYAVGYVRDVHQGKVDGQDVILGNLVITDQDAIDAIENGEHTDLSCGYECDIKDDGNGQYSQNNIRGNHVALCKEGRAGNARIVDSITCDAVVKNADELKFIENANKIHKVNNPSMQFVVKDISDTSATGYASKDGKTWFTTKTRVVRRNNKNDTRHQEERRFTASDYSIEIPFSHIQYCYHKHLQCIDNETIDHVDGNHMNDAFSNLEAVSIAENTKRNVKRMKEKAKESKQKESKQKDSREEDSYMFEDTLSTSEKDLCDYMLENCREDNEDENDLLRKMKFYYSAYSSLARNKPDEVLDYFREHIDNSFNDSIKDFNEEKLDVKKLNTVRKEIRYQPSRQYLQKIIDDYKLNSDTAWYLLCDWGFRNEYSKLHFYDSYIVDRPEGAFKQISNALSSYTPTKLVVLGHGWKWKVSATPHGIVADFVVDDTKYGNDPSDMSRISTDSLKQDLQTYLQSKMQQHTVTVNSASFIKGDRAGIVGVRFRIGAKLKKDSLDDEEQYFYYDADEDDRSLEDYKRIMKESGLNITKVKGNQREAFIYYTGSSSAERRAADILGIGLDDSIKDSNIVDAWSGTRNGIIYSYHNGYYYITHENGKVERLPESKFDKIEDLYKYVDNIKDSSNLSASKALKMAKIVSMLRKK